jgi:hypothetical protein
MTDAPDDYDPVADAWASVAYAYEVIRQRMKAGGPGWEPKPAQAVSPERNRSPATPSSSAAY